MNPSIESQLKEFIAHNLVFSDEMDSLPENESLLATGVVDSTGIMELVEFVSARFGFEVPMKEITQVNFDSITRLAAYIRLHAPERKDQGAIEPGDVREPDQQPA